MKTATLVVLMLMILLGCTSLYPPPRKALLQVESPPHRTTLICDDDEMTPEMVAMCMKINNDVAYKDYKFNKNFNINGNFVSSRTDIETSTQSITVGRK